ncbi:MAG: PleD family two-component system response regulator [Pyrinomonadaceae bacterium]
MSKRKLLIADDSVTIQKVVNLTFADEGFEVFTAVDGGDALRQVSEFRPDVVLADVNLPAPNGYEICEMIRSTEEVRDLPVVLLVGSFEPFDEERAMRAGANDVLTKPFSSIRQLVATVTELIDKTASDADDRSQPEAETASDQLDTIQIERAELAASGAELEPRSTSDIDRLYGESLGIAAPDETPNADAAEAAPAGGVDDENFIRTISDREPAEYFANEPETEASLYEPDETAPASAGDEAMAFSEDEPVPDEAGEPAGEAAAAFPDDDAWDDGTITETRLNAPTPWDSVAEPVGPVIDFSEPEILEIGTSTTDAHARSEAPLDELGDRGISDETIERIARRVAERMSESEIRQIVERVVPEVVEAFIVRKFGGGGRGGD